MDEEDGGGWMRLDTKCELHITVPYQTWKTLEDCAYNRTVRRCSVSYETNNEGQVQGRADTAEMETSDSERQGKGEETPLVSNTSERETTSNEPEIEFIEVIYE